MNNVTCSGPDTWTRMRSVALALATICGCGWLLFGLLKGIADKMPLNEVGWLALWPGAVFLATAIFAMYWTAPGGVLLFFEGALVLVGYPQVGCGFCVTALVMLTMGVPMLVAGVLLIIAWGRSVPQAKPGESPPGAEPPRA